jgi:hypothetical protein
MSNQDQEDAFERQVSALLHASTDDLDSDTRAALLRARRRALESAKSKARPAWRYLAPAGAVAALLLVAMFMRGVPLPGRGVDADPAAAPELDLLTDNDAWDIAQESDLEFIEWAAAQARQQGVGG